MPRDPLWFPADLREHSIQCGSCSCHRLVRGGFGLRALEYSEVLLHSYEARNETADSHGSAAGDGRLCSIGDTTWKMTTPEIFECMRRSRGSSARCHRRHRADWITLKHAVRVDAAARSSQMMSSMTRRQHAKVAVDL
mmetsp:Transcript_7453/g.16473  ORF Transcript_7453/g.16473 Transcript_7453/m.16473 type:complete len:138 (+) Transcript_7453:147-560(+)